MAKYFWAVHRDLIVALNFITLAGLSLCAHFPTGSGDTFTSKDSQTGILLQIVETAMEKSQHKNTLRFFSATLCLIFLCRAERDYGNEMQVCNVEVLNHVCIRRQNFAKKSILSK